MGERLRVSVLVQLLWTTSHTKFCVPDTSVEGANIKSTKVKIITKKCEPGRRLCAMCVTAWHS